MTAAFEMVALTTSRIYLMIYFIDITYIDKICNWIGLQFKFLCELIGCDGVNYKGSSGSL